jgi:hypothetical protein
MGEKTAFGLEFNHYGQLATAPTEEEKGSKANTYI